MSDIDRENQASSPVSVTGGDELHKADVVSDVDGIKKLHVKATLTDGDVSVSTALRIIESQTSVAIGTASFSTIYSLNAAAVCSGFMLKANTSSYTVKLTIDGIAIFEVDTSFLSDFTNWNNSSNPATWISFNSAQNIFYFVPTLPIKSATSIALEVKSNQGNREIQGYYIQVAEL